MKKIKINWFRIYFNYKRDNDSMQSDSVTISTSQANVNLLKKEIKNFFKNWSGRGHIEITAIDAGAFLEAEAWAKKNSNKFVGKKFKFNN